MVFVIVLFRGEMFDKDSLYVFLREYILYLLY